MPGCDMGEFRGERIAGYVKMGRVNLIDEAWLGEIERRHNLFPDVDYRLYA